MVVNKDQFEERLKEKFSNHIILVDDEFNGMSGKNNFKCKNGHKFTKTNRKFFEKNCRDCEFCLDIERIDKYHSLIDSEISSRDGEYRIIEYSDKHSDHMLVEHSICKNSYRVTLSNFRRRNCPFCSHKKPKRDTKWFIDQLEDDYELLSDYEKTTKKVKLRHKKCGNIFMMTPAGYLNNHSRCPECQHPSKKKTQEEFVKDVKDLHGDTFTVIGLYENNKKPVDVRCNICFKVKKIVPISLLRKDGNSYYSCGCGKSSRPEKFIERILDKNLIDYKREYRFDNCRDKRPLPFDFYLVDYNTIIEYDGMQHYKPIFGVKRFKDTVHHDKIKDDYCQEHGLTLIRIKYTSNLLEEVEKIVQRLSKGKVLND